MPGETNMQEMPVTADTRIETEALIGLASQLVRRGYGEPVIVLALRRRGASQEVAQLVAASVASCHAALLMPQADAERQEQTLQAARQSDLRAARAASLALEKILSFFVFIVLGIGGGAVFGWSIGFGQGIDDGFDWAVRTLEQLVVK